MEDKVFQGPVRMFICDEDENGIQSTATYFGNYRYNPLIGSAVYKTFADVVTQSLMNLKSQDVKKIYVALSMNKVVSVSRTRDSTGKGSEFYAGD